MSMQVPSHRCACDHVMVSQVLVALQNKVGPKPQHGSYMQVAPIYGEGVRINMPVLAERLVVGEGWLVQWSLQQTSNTGLGLTLLVEEVLDRAEKLRQFCVAQENLEVVHNVAATLQSCSKLLAKCALEMF